MKEDRLYAFQLSEGVYKRKEVTLEGMSVKFGELSDVDVSQAVPKQLHTLAFTGSKWIAFADPVPTGWLIDIKLSSSYVDTGKRHKVRKIKNSGTRLCSDIPETKNIVVSEDYMLRPNDSHQGILKMVSEFSPAGIIGLGLSTSTILLEIFLGDRPDDHVDVLPGFKIRWGQTNANKNVGIYILVQETPQVKFTLEDVQHRTDYRLLDIAKIMIGPVALKMIRLTPGELTVDQSMAVFNQYSI